MCCLTFLCKLTFRFVWLMESWIKQHLFEIQIFCNIINVFTVTFDQFNITQLNKSINLTIPKYINGSVCGLIKQNNPYRDKWALQYSPKSYVSLLLLLCLINFPKQTDKFTVTYNLSMKLKMLLNVTPQPIKPDFETRWPIKHPVAHYFRQ